MLLRTELKQSTSMLFVSVQTADPGYLLRYLTDRCYLHNAVVTASAVIHSNLTPPVLLVCYQLIYNSICNEIGSHRVELISRLCNCVFDVKLLQHSKLIVAQCKTFKKFKINSAIGLQVFDIKIRYVA